MDVFKYFMNLYRGRKQVILLSWAYLFMAVVSVLIAGICALINQSVGVGMLILPLIAITALCANIVVWSFVRFIIDVITIRIREKQLIDARIAERAAEKAAEKATSRTGKSGKSTKK